MNLWAISISAIGDVWHDRWFVHQKLLTGHRSASKQKYSFVNFFIIFIKLEKLFHKLGSN